MLKRISVLLLVLLLIGSSLVACGQKSSEVQAGGSAENTTESTGLEEVTLTWYFIGNGQQEDVAKVEAAASDYLHEKGLNVNLKLQCYDWGSYDQKMRTMIAAREEFDICFTASWANNYQQQAVKGAFVPLNQLLDDYGQETKKMLGKDFISGTQIDGINYAVPANKEKAHQWGVIVRKDLLEKYDLSIDGVKSLEDLEPLLEVVHNGEKGKVYALEAVTTESPFRILDFDRVGDDRYPGVVWNDSKDMKVFNEFTTTETMNYFKTMRKYFEKGYIRPDSATVTDANADLSAGKIFAATRSLKPGKDAEMTTSTGYEWVQIEMTNPIISNRDTSGSMQAISTTSENPERAMMLIELFNTDPYFNNLINFGIEGSHYKKISDQVIEPDADNTKYNPGTGWMFGNQFINYLWANEDPEKWSKFKAFNDQAVGTRTLGFVFDPTPVKTQIAACNNVWDQYVPALETGAVDPDEYVEKLLMAFEEAGADEIIAEKQKQLNAWMQ